MPASSLHNLAEQFCELINVPAPQLTPDRLGVLAFSAKLRGVDITVTQDPLRHPDHASALLFFGQVPEDRELLILRQLLNFNLDMLQPNFPAFSRNPLTGSVILQYVFPLALASGQGLLTGLMRLIDSILQWRQDFSLDEGDIVPTPPVAVAIGQLA